MGVVFSQAQTLLSFFNPFLLFQRRAQTGVQDIMRWWDEDTVAVVTGANKGIGFEITKLLATMGFRTVLTARDEARGQEAVKRLRRETGKTVDFHTLDITSAESVASFKAWAEEQYPQGITALVNNAGFAFKGSVFGAQEAQETLDVNYKGTREVTEQLLPLLKDGQGRIVVVGSMAGRSGIIKSADLLTRLQACQSDVELNCMLYGQFVQGIAAGTFSQEGWPKSMYGVSKLGLHLYCRLLAQRLVPRKIAVNVCCPGWCATDMSSNRGIKTAAQGADTPVWLASLPPGETATNKFFSSRQEQPF